MPWTALGLTVETTVFILAGCGWFLSRGYTVAEAGAGAVVAVFMALSLIHQACIFTGSPLPGFIMEAGALAVIAWAAIRRLAPLIRTSLSAGNMLRQAPLPVIIIATAWMVMAGMVASRWFSAPHLPTGSPGYGLVVLGAKDSPMGLDISGPLSPLNGPALFYHATRFGLGPNACGFGLLAYMAVGLSTYALARRYAWTPMALTVALLVLSMPRLVFLGLYPSAELISVAAIVYSVVLLYRLLEQHRAGDLPFFILCMLFSIDANPMSIARVAVIGALMMVVMIRRHGWLLWREMLAAKPLLSTLTLIPALGLAQIPVFALNLLHGQPLFGTAFALDNDAIRGAVANLIRYLMVSFDPTEPVQRALAWLIGLDLNRLAMGIYNTMVAPVFGLAGADAPFALALSGSGYMNFGPFAPLLVAAAMVHALARGPRRLRALSVAWVGYLYLVSLVVAWESDNLTMLCPLYAANGFLVAFSLPPWRLRRRGMRMLQIAFGFLLAWSLGYCWWMP